MIFDVEFVKEQGKLYVLTNQWKLNNITYVIRDNISKNWMKKLINARAFLILVIIKDQHEKRIATNTFA